MMNWPSWVLSGLALVLALVSFLWNRQKVETEASVHVTNALAQLHERCSLLEMKMGMFWRLIEEHLSTMLKRPSHLEMDMLLDKLKAHTLTLEEAKLLHRWLQRVYLDETGPEAGQQRLVAILVVAAVDSLIHELEKAAS